MSPLEDVASLARQHLQSDETGYLYLGIRNRIWDCLKDLFPSNWHWRRASLGYFAAAKTVGGWNALPGVPAEFQSLPVDILLSCQRALISKSKTSQDVEEYWFYEGFVEQVWSRVDYSSDTEPALQGVDAALAALHQSLWPEYVWGGGRYDARDEEASQRDPHCLAGATLVGEDIGDLYLAEPARLYWLTWLDDLLPMVCGDFDTLTNELGIHRIA